MDVNLNIDEKDIALVKDYLKGKTNPVGLQDIAYRIALFKTRESRTHRVKLYNPGCEYKVGDLIYKEYPGKIPVGSKKYIEIESGVVLNVVAVRTRFGIEEVKLNYEGTSEFKRYTSYLYRQKIELLLPHKQEKPPEKSEFLAEEEDPRKQNAPLEKREFTHLTRKLVTALNKESDVVLISSNVLLKENIKPMDTAVFEKIREFLKENKKSETTEFFVENFARIKLEDEDFAAHCFSLSYRMQKDYKIDFQQTQDQGWGKWNLISVIYYLKKNSIVSDPNPLMQKVTFYDKKNLSHRRRKFEESLLLDSVPRFYLTQREISAGAVKLKPGFFDLGDAIEVEIHDAKHKRTHLVYYYKDVHLMLGFKDIFERYKALQGTIMSFEMVPNGDGDEGNRLQFSIKTTKKGTISDRVEYIPEEKAFKVFEEKVASPVFVNKSMFLEPTIFKKVYEDLDELRKINSLNKLTHKVFLEFGVKERNYEIHILRLYHILDLIYPMDLKIVEEVILSNPEFVPAEKISGVFYLDSDAVVEIEEEELKRKESEVDELRKKRDELRRKKSEQERRIKEEVRRKREERRLKREQEMWEKERLKKELEEKKVLESQKKKVAPRAKTQMRPERSRKTESRPSPTDSTAQKPPRRKDSTARNKPEFPEASPTATPEEAALKKEHARRAKKKVEEDKTLPKTQKRTDRPARDESMSEEDIKSQIELERLKENMRDRKGNKKSAKKKEIAYKDSDQGFGGIFASKLDEIVKKDSGENRK
ncbi:MAG: hypothetical protein GY940_46125 [bacterium]|nr:hypothetical protein [bacterium]